MSRITLKEAIIVEGKYDCRLLREIFDAPVIETAGFRIFNDDAKRRLISRLANQRGVVILTDSDGAGFVIRNYLKGTIKGNVYHAYIPALEGKESRKTLQSKEGLLGVEGMDREAVIAAVRASGAHMGGPPVAREQIDSAFLYEHGLIGAKNSSRLRRELLKMLDLPQYLSTKAMCGALSALMTKEELVGMVGRLRDGDAGEGC